MVKTGLGTKRRKILEKELSRILPIIINQGVEKIILFGSLAVENLHKSSDIDLLIVQRTNKRFLERLDFYYSTLLPHCKIDFFVYTPEEFEEMEKGNHFVQSIVRKGKVMYEK